MLQELPLPTTAPVVLLHSLDPANLYGAGAPFDLTLPDDDRRSVVRRSGTWLMIRAGRPVLVIEQHGKRVTAMGGASRADLADAISCLPAMLSLDRGSGSRTKLTIEEWNGQPVISTDAVELLAAAGFVRDYQGMTLYSGVR
jgi:ATP-dependent helicase Lhr and Lhr-like helicase